MGVTGIIIISVISSVIYGLLIAVFSAIFKYRKITRYYNGRTWEWKKSDRTEQWILGAAWPMYMFWLIISTTLVFLFNIGSKVMKPICRIVANSLEFLSDKAFSANLKISKCEEDENGLVVKKSKIPEARLHKE